MINVRQFPHVRTKIPLSRVVYAILVLLMGNGINSWGQRWPAEHDFMTSSFLDDRQPFLVFKNYDSLQPFDQGNVLFRHFPDPWSALPDTAGGILVLEHANGLLSIYSNISKPETRTDARFFFHGDFLKPPNGMARTACVIL